MSRCILIILMSIMGLSSAMAADNAGYVTDTVKFINYERAKTGALPLGTLAPLSCAAQTLVADIGGKYVCQNVPTDGSSPWELPRRCGGIAYGLFVGCGFQTPELAVNGWRQRSDISAMMLNPKFRTIGVAMLNNYWVVFLGL